jgi:hypothetical protein
MMGRTVCARTVRGPLARSAQGFEEELLLPDTLIEYVGVMVVGDGGGQRPNDQRVGLG